MSDDPNNSYVIGNASSLPAYHFRVGSAARMGADDRDASEAAAKSKLTMAFTLDRAAFAPGTQLLWIIVPESMAMWFLMPILGGGALERYGTGAVILGVISGLLFPFGYIKLLNSKNFCKPAIVISSLFWSGFWFWLLVTHNYFIENDFILAAIISAVTFLLSVWVKQAARKKNVKAFSTKT